VWAPASEKLELHSALGGKGRALRSTTHISLA
jgi:hypothetical protein